MVLRQGYLTVATKLQEAAAVLSDNDKRSRLADTLSDTFRGTGNWAYLVDIFGDDKDGEVVYALNDDLKKASYIIADTKCTIDTATAKGVFPLTTYIEEGIELGEAGARNSKSDMRHIQAIHDAAQNLGAACPVKESAVGGGNPTKESAGHQSGQLKLTESAAFAADITIREALTPGRKIKLIAPGEGSSAYYTVESLRKAADDKIFHAGLPMRIDHPTKAEEAARPEGSVKDWGAVLGSDAVYLESCVSGGKDLGAGLYSEIKPFSDYAQIIDEKGPYAGVSISANGNAVMEASGKPQLRKGKPVLKEFTSAEGADMVTRAGAGGLFLQESARGADDPTEEASMDAEELKQLRESLAAQRVDTNKLLEKERRREAIAEGAKALKGLSLTEAQKEYIIGTVLKEALPLKDGALDVIKFAEALNAEAMRFGAALGTPGVRGMGSAPPVPIDVKEAERRAGEETKLRESAVRNLIGLGSTEAAAKAAVAHMFEGEAA